MSVEERVSCRQAVKLTVENSYGFGAETTQETGGSEMQKGVKKSNDKMKRTCEKPVHFCSTKPKPTSSK